MAGARALWRANGLKEEQFGKPIIAIVNSFTQFVPGHVHLLPNSIRLPLTMVSLWDTTECSIRFLRVILLRTASSIW